MYVVLAEWILLSPMIIAFELTKLSVRWLGNGLNVWKTSGDILT